MSEVKEVDYTVKEEIANSITHGVGVVLSIAALVVLVSLASMYGDIWRIVSFSIFGGTLVFLYLASTFYHVFRSQRAKDIFRVLDHSAIFLLIAGTYTPFTLVNLNGVLGWTIFGIIWGCAVIGVLMKVFCINRLRIFSTVLYVIMGWFAIFAIKPLLNVFSVSGFVWLITGGISYTFGLIFYCWNTLPFNHAVWHLFVLVGSVCHFFCMLYYTLPLHSF